MDCNEHYVGVPYTFIIVYFSLCSIPISMIPRRDPSTLSRQSMMWEYPSITLCNASTCLGRIHIQIVVGVRYFYMGECQQLIENVNTVLQEISRY